MEALQASGISRAFGAQQVLRDFALTIPAGGFDALMGPSGSGKSTFLHLAAGLLVPDAGSIALGGTDIVRMSDAQATRFRRRHVGVVFQAFNLLDHLTVRENIVLPVRLDHGSVDKARLATLIERLGLTGKEDRLPTALSGGERQRVAIARALFCEPDVVLADEPTGNLDALSAKEICRLLMELNKTEKSAILLVTHDPVVAACATRVHFIKDGAIATSFETQHDAARISASYLETYK